MRGRLSVLVGVSVLAGQAMAQPVATMDPRPLGASCSTPWPEAPAADGAWTVGMAVRVGADGRLLEVRLLRSSGSAALDEGSLAALKSCQFRPGQVEGKPVEAWTEISKLFTREAGQWRVADAPRPERHD